MMTTDNFEKQVSPVILERGRSYFNDGLVGELDEGDHVWTAEVYGSEDYLVDITLDEKGGIREYFCDCPYDGDLCKHVVAVCYCHSRRKGKTTETKTCGTACPIEEKDIRNPVG